MARYRICGIISLLRECNLSVSAHYHSATYYTKFKDAVRESCKSRLRDDNEHSRGIYFSHEANYPTYTIAKPLNKAIIFQDSSVPFLDYPWVAVCNHVSFDFK